MAEVELLNLRSATRKIFDAGGGIKRYNFHIGNIHYPDSNNVFQNIDTTLLTKAGGMYQDKCFYACEVPDLATGVFTYFNKDHNFDLKLIGIKPQGYSLILPNAVGFAPIPNDPWGNIGKGVRYSGVFGTNIHFEVICANSRFEKRLRIDAPPPVQYRSVPIGIVFEILTKPDVFEIGDEAGFAPLDINLDEATALEYDRKIWRIRSSIGQRASYIRRPKCWDSSGRTLPVKVKFYRTAAGRFFLVKIIPPEIWTNAVYPVFADDPVAYYQGAGDGAIENGYGVWATIRAATTGVASYTLTDDDFAFSFCDPSNNKKINRGFLPVDTSGIADGDTITAASQYLYVSSKSNDDNDGDDFMVIVGQTTQASPTSLIGADYDQCGAVDSPSEGSSRIDIGSITAAAYNTWALNATGLTWVSKTGYTLIGMREGHDVINSELANLAAYAGNRIKIRYSEYTGTANDPYLDVTSSAGGGAKFPTPHLWWSEA